MAGDGGHGGIWRAAPVLGLLLLLPGCGNEENPPPADPAVRIVASLPPLASWVEDLAPPGTEINAAIGPGQSPHVFEPGPEELASLAKADLIVTVGLGLEASLPARLTGSAKTLEMAAALGIGGASGQLSGGSHPHDGHEHGEGAEPHDAHDHGGVDPHLWLDPALVERFVPLLAERVREVLTQSGASADEIAVVDEREEELLGRIRGVDRAYADRLAPFAGAAVITQHAAWSRLVSRYGVEIVGVIQPNEGMEPPPGHIAELIELTRTRNVRAVLSEPQLDASAAARLAERLALPLGTLDPLGQGDWEAMMMRNLESLTGALAERESPEQ